MYTFPLFLLRRHRVSRTQCIDTLLYSLSEKSPFASPRPSAYLHSPSRSGLSMICVLQRAPTSRFQYASVVPYFVDFCVLLLFHLRLPSPRALVRAWCLWRELVLCSRRWLRVSSLQFTCPCYYTLLVILLFTALLTSLGHGMCIPSDECRKDETQCIY